MHQPCEKNKESKEEQSILMCHLCKVTFIPLPYREYQCGCINYKHVICDLCYCSNVCLCDILHACNEIDKLIYCFNCQTTHCPDCACKK